MDSLATRTPVPGDKIVHFRREYCTEKELLEDPYKYIYEVVCTALSTEEAITMLVYKELGSMHRTWVRPLIQFNSLVDKKDHPGIKQMHRFEFYEGQ